MMKLEDRQTLQVLDATGKWEWKIINIISKDAIIQFCFYEKPSSEKPSKPTLLK